MIASTPVGPNKLAVAAPVIRIGRLVRAAYQQDDDEPVTLSSKEAEEAIELLKARAGRIEAVVRKFISQSVKGARVEKCALTEGLRQAGPSTALGPIFDFSDMRLIVDGFVLIGRLCLTVCVAPKPLPEGADRSHSKFWLRLRVESGPNGTNVLAPADINKLVDVANRISKAAFYAMKPPYEKIVSIIADRPVTITLQETISIFMANADDGLSFDKLFSDVRAGRSFAESARKPGNAARELLGAAVAVFPAVKKCKGRSNLSSELKRLDGDLGYFGFEDVGGYRGVVVAKYLDNLASFVGFAKGPQVVPTEGRPTAPNTGEKPRLENAANRVSAKIIGEMASRF